MTRKWQTILELVFRLISGAFVAFFICVFLCGCADERLNPLGTEQMNGSAPKQEAYCIQMDCKGYYNGVWLPKDNYVSQSYPMRFTGKWTQIPNGVRDDWYMAMTSEVGARLDICATMTRCVFDFWDYEFYNNPGTIQVLLDDRVVGTFNLARTNSNGFKILDYVVATQKNTVATASIVLLSGRMVVSGAQVNVFDSHFPY